MIESVGSTNILYRFMNNKVSLLTLPNSGDLYSIQAAVTKLFHQSANSLIDVKRCFKALVYQNLLLMTWANFRLQDSILYHM